VHVEDLLSETPDRAAARFVAAVREGTGRGPGATDDAAREWVGRFVGELDRLAERDAFARVLDTWALTNAEAGRLLGVSRQAVAKWRANGLPEERRAVVGELAAVTDLLVRYLKRERIPAVVRRPAERLGGRSMLDLVAEGRSGELLAFTRDLFDLRRLDAA
jgi:hypothetical protein